MKIFSVAADVSDYNGCLWNNIGIGLLARNKPAASHSALKKAAFINPLNYKYEKEWLELYVIIIQFNSGSVIIWEFFMIS